MISVTIEPAVLARHGAIAAGALLCEGPAAPPEAGIIDAIRRQGTEEGLRRLRAAGGYEHTEPIIAWRAIYRAMGTADSKPSSIESLYKCLEERGSLPVILPMVDLYNAISCATGFPMAGYDCFHIVGGRLTLRMAVKGEPFTPLGTREVQKTKHGEVVYADEERIVCRYWNFRDCDATRLRPDTCRYLFLIDKAPQVSISALRDALGLLEETIVRVGAPWTRSIVLDAGRPEGTLDTDSS